MYVTEGVEITTYSNLKVTNIVTKKEWEEEEQGDKEEKDKADRNKGDKAGRAVKLHGYLHGMGSRSQHVMATTKPLGPQCLTSYNNAG